MRPRKFAVPRFRFGLKLLLLLTALVAVALAAWKPLLIRYHTRGRDHAAERASGSAADATKRACLRDYEGHLAALVDLGYCEERVFLFQHLSAGSPESRDLLASLREYNDKLPLADRFASKMVGSSPSDSSSLTLWAKAEHMEDLTAIVASYDSVERVDVLYE